MHPRGAPPALLQNVVITAPRFFRSYGPQPLPLARLLALPFRTEVYERWSSKRGLRLTQKPCESKRAAEAVGSTPSRVGGPRVAGVRAANCKGVKTAYNGG
jgi:hypothetical protein